jgi:hypothetical protein
MIIRGSNESLALRIPAAIADGQHRVKPANRTAASPIQVPVARSPDQSLGAVEVKS